MGGVMDFDSWCAKVAGSETAPHAWQRSLASAAALRSQVIRIPTGMGKTTTVFAILERVDEGKNICTVEDPVEIRLRGAHQVEVNERHGVTFASAMRAFMRQDPDVIFCGEMRDDETAFETMKGGLSGRVVYSTIHAPDAVRVSGSQSAARPEKSPARSAAVGTEKVCVSDR